MPAPRRLTDVAIDCAIHGHAEPKSGWRAHVPPEDLGAMFGGGSAQINLQALVAELEYGPRDEAVRKLVRYAERCVSAFMASEPWSAIYGRAIVSCWLAVVLIARRHGLFDLAYVFVDLLARWAATCRLMEADVEYRTGKRRRRERHVLHAGCRCWGHAQGPSGLSHLWAIAAARAEPPRSGGKGYGKPGADDNWGWLDRAPRVGLAVLREIGAEFPAGENPATLLRRMPRWAARVEMQLLGWADGSRLWLMGDDETDFDDEDPNSNTPGYLAAGVLGGRLVILPRWPNPVNGARRLRQTNSRADLDGNPRDGWVLVHSNLGEERLDTGAGFISRLPPYTAAPLAFRILVPARSLEWQAEIAA